MSSKPKKKNSHLESQWILYDHRVLPIVPYVHQICLALTTGSKYRNNVPNIGLPNHGMIYS